MGGQGGELAKAAQLLGARTGLGSTEPVLSGLVLGDHGLRPITPPLCHGWEPAVCQASGWPPSGADTWAGPRAKGEAVRWLAQKGSFWKKDNLRPGHGEAEEACGAEACRTHRFHPRGLVNRNTSRWNSISIQECCGAGIFQHELCRANVFCSSILLHDAVALFPSFPCSCVTRIICASILPFIMQHTAEVSLTGLFISFTSNYTDESFAIRRCGPLFLPALTLLGQIAARALEGNASPGPSTMEPWSDVDGERDPENSASRGPGPPGLGEDTCAPEAPEAGLLQPDSSATWSWM
ncbi:hypothetical protein MDA_GLEAN10024837 [Myotis davidii]|uniref:Uncharacterized protein n=1 Tax=Myotis davidii TaxID=225400 RepID=L5LXV9_MYODS|nr:hypothetical protein MDA_GLEAN10024837 [Myotis davidii]